MSKTLIIILIFSAFHISSCKLIKSSTDRPFTYLTYNQEDTSSHIVVNHLVSGHVDEKLSIKYKIKQDPEWIFVSIEPQQLPLIERSLYKFELYGLSANSKYQLQVIAEDEEEYWFKTLPSDNSPVTLLQGGDLSATKMLYEVSEMAINQKSPDVILIGGDIAYANGSLKNLDKWEDWFSYMQKVYISEDQQMRPMILAIGNHETNNYPAEPKVRAPFYTMLFQQDDRTFFSRKLGGHSILYVLDSGHVFSHKQQVDWLSAQLEKHQPTANQIALYHVPLYPSHRDYDEKKSRLGRKHWQPLFDLYNLDIAFENHDHLLKRTYPLKNGQQHHNGVIYLGDGCWGTGTRSSNENWYLEKTIQTQHVWTAELTASGMSFEAYSPTEMIDNFIKD